MDLLRKSQGLGLMARVWRPTVFSAPVIANSRYATSSSHEKHKRTAPLVQWQWRLQQELKRNEAAGVAYLRKITEENKLSRALLMCWTDMFKYLIVEQKKVSAAYHLWMDMKKRGIVPKTLMYRDFFVFVLRSCTDDVAQYDESRAPVAVASKTQVEKVTTIFRQWLAYLSKMPEGGSLEDATGLSFDESPPQEPIETLASTARINALPTSIYMRYLFLTQNYDLLFAVFFAEILPQKVPCDEFVYSTVLGALRKTRKADIGQITIEGYRENRPCDVLQLAESVFNDARARDKVDQFTLTTMFALYRDCPDQQDKFKAIELAQEFHGFVDTTSALAQNRTKGEVKPYQSCLTAQEPLIRADALSCENLFSLLVGLQAYDTAVEWTQQLRTHPNFFHTQGMSCRVFEKTIIACTKKNDCSYIEDLLHWMRQQGPEIRPREATYIHALEAFAKNGQSARTELALQWMTGHRWLREGRAGIADTDTYKRAMESSHVPPIRFGRRRQVFSLSLQSALASTSAKDVLAMFKTCSNLGMDLEEYELEGEPIDDGDSAGYTSLPSARVRIRPNEVSDYVAQQHITIDRPAHDEYYWTYILAVRASQALHVITTSEPLQKLTSEAEIDEYKKTKYTVDRFLRAHPESAWSEPCSEVHLEFLAAEQRQSAWKNGKEKRNFGNRPTNRAKYDRKAQDRMSRTGEKPFGRDQRRRSGEPQNQREGYQRRSPRYHGERDQGPRTYGERGPKNGFRGNRHEKRFHGETRKDARRT